MRYREQPIRPGISRVGLVVVAVLAALTTSCTSEEGASPTSAPPAGEQNPPTLAESCEEAADDTILAIQDFLDRLGDVTAAEAPMLEPIEVWLDAYSDQHRGISRLEGFVSDEITDREFEELAQSVAGWPGVSAIETLSKEQAIAHARQIFADNPEALEVLEKDPSFIPRSIRLAVDSAGASAIDEKLAAAPGIMQTTESGVSDIRRLAFGVFGLGVAGPYLRQPTADAERLGCADGLLTALQARSDELEPHGSAGAAFVEYLRRQGATSRP